MSTSGAAKGVQFDRTEVEDAFVHWWTVGDEREDWYGWVDLFTPDSTTGPLLGAVARP